MNKVKEIILKYKAYIICIAIIILSIVSIAIQNKDRKETLKVNNSELENKEDKIAVYVSGAVKNPGVYYLDINSRIYNLLDICGGVEENADISKLNLAQKLNDSDKIEVPIKKESFEGQNDDEELEELKENDGKSSKVNINTATLEELKTLNGIGEATARKIIDYRSENEFEEIEDIMNVPGIGESKFNNIKENICT